MNALILTFLAASFASCANWLFRKGSLSAQGNTANGYLFCFYLLSFISSLFIYPELWTTSINFTMLIVGGAVGIFNVAIMGLTACALKRGPAGLTFAFQNAGAVFASMVLFSVFGTEFGFSCSYSQILGMGLVITGLFLGSRGTSGDSTRFSFSWLKYAILCLLGQVFALALIQGRCVLFEHDKLEMLSSFAVTHSDDIWFMPGQFGAALIVQTMLFLREKRLLKSTESLYGTMAGICNCVSTCLLLLGTQWASSFEKGILLPFFAVAVIIICKIWATFLYKEKFNFTANALCSLGIFIAI